MIIIHGMNGDALPRIVSASLRAMMRVMPAVVVAGARQTGKSTLARALGDAGAEVDSAGRRRYSTLDDLDVLRLARHDPGALVGLCCI